MRRTKGELWVSEIHKHGRRFRFCFGRAGAIIDRPSFGTREEAEHARESALREITAKKEEDIEDTLTTYAAYRTERGCKPVSVARELHRVRCFFHDCARVPTLTPAAAKARYRALQQRPTRTGKPPAAAEHQQALKAARRFGAWLVSEGYWKENPLEYTEPAGRALRGEESKAQLTTDQSVVFLNGALALYEECSDHAALAAALAQEMGLRASEAATRRCSHIDCEGTVLRITQAKSRRGWRGVPIPPLLQDVLHVQAAWAREHNRAQDVPEIDPYLFPAVYWGKGPRPTTPHLSRKAVLMAVWRVCDVVGLPRVCTQALRGGHASRAAEGGEPIESIARRLGNNPTVAARHYATPDSQAAGQAARLEAGRKARGGE